MCTFKRYYVVIFLLQIILTASALFFAITICIDYINGNSSNCFAKQNAPPTSNAPPPSTDVDKHIMSVYLRDDGFRMHHIQQRNSQPKFKDIKYNKHIYLYCGDIPEQRRIYTKKNFIGLTLRTSLFPLDSHKYHINHDIKNPFDIFDNSVDIVQLEDFFTDISYDKLTDIFNEIYRVLKPNGLFRLSMPDYGCDYVCLDYACVDYYCSNMLSGRAAKEYGDISFDISDDGLPKYERVWHLLNTTKFNMDKVHFLHYYDRKGKPVINKIDYSLGYIANTPDNALNAYNERGTMSIVVDVRK